MTDVERVARALCKADGRDPDTCVMGSGGASTNGVIFSECHRHAWQDYVGKAATAMRETRMIDAEALMDPDTETEFQCREQAADWLKERADGKR